MNPEVFVDTNVFLCALSDRAEEQAKAERARQLLLNENWGWSVQVAGEFYHIATSTKRQFSIVQFFRDRLRTNLAELSHCFASSFDDSECSKPERTLSIELLGCGNHRCRSRTWLCQDLLRGL